MEYTEQLFGDLFKNYLESRKKTYLNGRLGIKELSHFTKTFAVEFFNDKTKHLNFTDAKENYKKGQEDIILRIIDNLDTHIKQKEIELEDYKLKKNCTKKHIEIFESAIYEIRICKIIIQTHYKNVILLL
jgi:hypothetical protein